VGSSPTALIELAQDPSPIAHSLHYRLSGLRAASTFAFRLCSLGSSCFHQRLHPRPGDEREGEARGPVPELVLPHPIGTPLANYSEPHRVGEFDVSLAARAA